MAGIRSAGWSSSGPAGSSPSLTGSSPMLTEKAAREASGGGMAVAAAILGITGIGLFAVGIAGPATAAIVAGALLALAGFFLARGLTPVSPGQARVVLLFGRYTGTIRADGLRPAGVKVIESRLTRLSYAPEIAQAMLRRQQAGAVVAARQRIVDGAVGMVESALSQLGAGVVELDEERKAAMVSNLLVVLCSEHATQPVINTGTLYQ